MSVDQLLTLSGLYIASFWTPGPNNAMLAASGAAFGFRRTLGHMAGVNLGFAFMIFLVGLGLGEIFRAFPALLQIMRWIGAVLLLFVAWLIATAKAPGEEGARLRPMRFLEAVAFQWVNPKAWIMCLSIAPLFISAQHIWRDSLILALFAIIWNMTSSVGWISLGTTLSRYLTTPLRRRLFNGVMAGTIILGVVWLLVNPLAP